MLDTIVDYVVLNYNFVADSVNYLRQAGFVDNNYFGIV